MSRISTISDIQEIGDDEEASPSPRRGADRVGAGSPQHAPRPHKASSADGSSGSNAKWRSLRDHFHRVGATSSSASDGHPHPISDPDLQVASRRDSPLAGRETVSRTVSSRNPWPISDPELVSNRSNRCNPVRPLSVSLSVSVRNSEPPAREEPHPAIINKDGEEEADDGAGNNSVSDGEEEEGRSPEAAPLSLMALLGQTDDDWGGSEKEDEEEEEEELGTENEREGSDDGMQYVCCVCMVEHKGARFIPCGHTFCRLCSRELWVSSGDCPLCNGYILEILEIF
ncbi:hypothetical protein ZIOFF_054398 [Zingiber officinale]|uniref:RING-type domain-containing protein n=1 Tax=Zingiber officinale TaxID=94328 RepID=A0A8J5FK06_ZINOF|nr:hypothetical protein ZIOFF_054398 [Zingiber officinale]